MVRTPLHSLILLSSVTVRIELRSKTLFCRLYSCLISSLSDNPSIDIPNTVCFISSDAHSGSLPEHPLAKMDRPTTTYSALYITQYSRIARSHAATPPLESQPEPWGAVRHSYTRTSICRPVLTANPNRSLSSDDSRKAPAGNNEDHPTNLGEAPSPSIILSTLTVEGLALGRVQRIDGLSRAAPRPLWRRRCLVQRIDLTRPAPTPLDWQPGRQFLGGP